MDAEPPQRNIADPQFILSGLFADDITELFVALGKVAHAAGQAVGFFVGDLSTTS